MFLFCVNIFLVGCVRVRRLDGGKVTVLVLCDGPNVLARQAERVAGAGARTLLYPHSSHCSSHCSRWLAAFSAVVQAAVVQCGVTTAAEYTVSPHWQWSRCPAPGAAPRTLNTASTWPRLCPPASVRQPVATVKCTATGAQPAAGLLWHYRYYN